MASDLTEPEARALGERWIAAGGGIVLRMAVHPIMEDGTVEAATGTVVGFMGALPIVWWPDLNGTRAHHPTEHMLPEFRDDATKGAALGVVRRRCPDPDAFTTWHGGRWVCAGLMIAGNALELDIYGRGRTEEEAIVAALEAAPPSPSETKHA